MFRKSSLSVVYLIMVLIFTGLMYWISLEGLKLESGVVAVKTASEVSHLEYFGNILSHNFTHPLSVLILQIIAIILVSRILGYLFNRISQPTVIGEIVAGIALGPSLLGLFFPEISEHLFPPGSLEQLKSLSQIGLVLFMFVIGMELDLNILKKKAHDAVIISHASILIPYFLGMVLAYALYSRFAPEGVSFLAFSLFVGIAMSITAFPVLARIIQERGLTKTRLGIIAITCAAADDVTAWCLLAAVIAIVKAGSFVSALYTISMAVLYVLFMLAVARPLLAKMGRMYSSRERMTKTIVAILFLVLLSSAWMAEIIGIHALFGAFLAGVIMPTGPSFRKLITDKVEDVSLVLLLPLFFVFTGLKTRIDLLNDPELWYTSALIIAVAVAGKFGGSALAAKFVGIPWKISLSIGALMNTRGLMELIVLNIGLELGILSDEMFTMMVLMALVTTFMTGPALAFINFLYRNKSQSEDEQSIDAYRTLISFGPALKGKKMLRIAHLLSYGRPETDFTAMHLTPNPDVNRRDAKQYEKESFKPVRAEAKLLDIPLHTLYRVTGDLTRDIISTANKNNFDLMLVGATRSIFTGDQLGGKVKTYLDDIRCSIGVFIDKDFESVTGILLCTDGTENETLIPLLPHLRDKKDFQFRSVNINDSETIAKMNIQLNPANDLLIMNRATWEKLNSLNSPLTENYSILILQYKKD